MKYLLLSLLLITQTCLAQNYDVAALEKKLCTHKTDGSEKYHGIRMSLSVPCAWKEVADVKGNIAKSFNDEESDNMVLETIKISPLKDPNKKIDDIVNGAESKKSLPKGSTFISSRKLKIGSMECGELLFSMNKNLVLEHIYLYLFNYYFIYQGKSIVINYTVGADNEKAARAMFDAYKGLILKLASATKFDT